jgi:hypothetical protein
MNKNTILVYKLGGVKYRKVFTGRVSYGSIERFLVMEKHVGISQHRNVIVEIENQLS